MAAKTTFTPVEHIALSIVMLRGQRVLLDAELAALYGVTTRRLNEQVRRNRARFPDDFLFELSAEEFTNLKSHFATSSWGGRRKRPLAFTEHGAIQAATILNSPRAVQMSVHVVRAFVRLRELLSSNRELAGARMAAVGRPLPAASLPHVVSDVESEETQRDRELEQRRSRHEWA